MSDTVIRLNGLSIDDDAAPASASTRFPNEVVENIAHLTTDPATLACWMRVSRTMYNIVAPHLYVEGVVTRMVAFSSDVKGKSVGLDSQGKKG
jgi:hypothetical protein